MKDKIIIVRGGGDLASGVIHRLYRCGYRVLILESERPSCIRRMVSFCEAVYDGESFVEGVLCRKAEKPEDCRKIWEEAQIPLLTDPLGKAISVFGEQGRVGAVIDGILAKKNLGTKKDMAPVTIALGPGFTAGEDVDFVVETMRGHDLGRIIEDGSALPNTGIPGVVAGVSKERVIHSPAAGIFHGKAKIADVVKKDQILAYVDETPVRATISGVLRGILRDGYPVPKGMKAADIDPRITEIKNCYTISDKARCIAGSVVEILMNQGILP